MALLERGLKQRIVGALVLIALAVIFLPMLFTREDESRQVVVEAPPRPQAPAMPSVEVQPTEVPELQPGEDSVAALCVFCDAVLVSLGVFGLAKLL
ncbi:hypothetical protein PRO73_29170, partial [Pseudomonas aeruginosa]|nr:hypothetical protein [Pseudomonas aeruginosa]